MKNLKITRLTHELTMEQMAQIFKTTHATYSRWEAGKVEIPLHKLIEIADFFNLSLDYLADRTNK